jgi:glycosyltransferase involved in cell wall biosynthesis
MASGAKISVIIPIYNNADNAVRAVFSVLRQTVPAHEIILVDDASSAEEAGKLQRLLRRCRSCVAIQLERLEENAGPGLARHIGARLASGTHVAFLDADDLWHCRKIEKVIGVIETESADLIGHNRPWRFSISRADLTELPATIPCRALGRQAFLRRNPIPTSSIVAQARIAREMFRFGGRKSEDYMALITASRMANRAVYLDADLCWAPKPPFGYVGEGADQMKIYRASVENILVLHRERVISAWNLVTFFFFLSVRAPVGMLRLHRYRLLYKSKQVDRV